MRPTNVFILIHNSIGLPTDDARDVLDDPAGLMAVSGMCRSSALKKLYNWNGTEKNHTLNYGCSA